MLLKTALYISFCSSTKLTCIQMQTGLFGDSVSCFVSNIERTGPFCSRRTVIFLGLILLRIAMKTSYIKILWQMEQNCILSPWNVTVFTNKGTTAGMFWLKDSCSAVTSLRMSSSARVISEVGYERCPKITTWTGSSGFKNVLLSFPVWIQAVQVILCVYVSHL